MVSRCFTKSVFNWGLHWAAGLLITFASYMAIKRYKLKKYAVLYCIFAVPKPAYVNVYLRGERDKPQAVFLLRCKILEKFLGKILQFDCKISLEKVLKFWLPIT